MMQKDLFTVVRPDGTELPILAFEPSHAANIYAASASREHHIVDLHAWKCRWIVGVSNGVCILFKQNFGRTARARGLSAKCQV